jgi:predicted peptidase
MRPNLNLFRAVTALHIFAMNIQAQSTNAAVAAETFRWKIAREGDLNYLLYFPKDYSATDGKRWPLMLFLHGSGERGTDVQRVATHGPMKLVKQGTNFPFIIVAPQCPPKQLWQSETLLQLLDEVTAKFAVDTNRIYLTGLSMGGYGAWQLGLQHPDRFAALVPICGGGNAIDVVLGPGDKGETFKTLPVWAFHGAQDDVVPVDESERIVKGLKKQGVKEVKLTVYPEAKHDSWTATYNNPELYEWLATKHR